jgi:hypothetical protein
MTGVAARLTRALQQAGIPILGVSIGQETDRATWRIDYAPAATAQHRTDGETLRQTFDPLAATEDQKDRQEERDQDVAKKIIRALAVAIHKRFKTGGVTGDTVTVAQWEAAIRSEYDAL